MNFNACLIAGRWLPGHADNFRRHSPGSGKLIWDASHASADDAHRAVSAARVASAHWAGLSFESRRQAVEAFGKQVKADRDNLARIISLETGKPHWEALAEVDSIAGKVDITIQAACERAADRVNPTSSGSSPGRSAVRYRPHGVVAVIGPFNLPGHLPNGHIVPALLMGNTVVFKPSELTPLTAQRMCELWQNAGLPDGVINLIQAGPQVGRTLAAHPDIDGLYFTGSYKVGLQLSQMFAGVPHKILALEMGGNNPLIVWHTSNITPAVYDIIQSAYITAGQRCTCARRLIIPKGPDGDDLLHTLIQAVERLDVSSPDTRPEPFMGPLITQLAAHAVLDAQKAMITLGCLPLVKARVTGSNTSLLRPGLLDATGVLNIPDVEVFGPLLQVIRVDSFDRAVQEANTTRYGLAAGLLSDDPSLFDLFFARSRAGVVNFNRPTTGASAALPFGGVGLSGNHRPSGYFAVDYCAYPVASLEHPSLSLPKTLSPGINL